MVKDAKVMAVGLALTAMAACTTTNHYYPTPADGGSSDSQGEVEYTCETACKNIIYTCECTTPTTENLKYCIEQDCGGKKESKTPWTQEKREYLSNISCDKAC